MPCFRISLESVASDSGLRVTEGKISPSPFESRRAPSSTARTTRPAHAPAAGASSAVFVEALCPSRRWN